MSQPDGTTLMYNSLTGALATFDPESWQRIQPYRKGAAFGTVSEIDQHLLDEGFIVPQEMDEIVHLKGLHTAAQHDPTVWTMTICPTIACNFKCDYCFEVHQPGKMSMAVQDAIVDALMQRAQVLQQFVVTWFGGEPTLAWDVIEALTRRFQDICAANQIEYSAAMISNGFLLDEHKVKELDAMQITNVQITLDGGQEYHDTRRILHSGKGTFDRIVTNLGHFAQVEASATIRVNVDERNEQGVFALIDRLCAAGLSGHENISIYFAAITSTTAPSQNVHHHCMSRRSFSKKEVEYYDYAVASGLAAMPFPTQNYAGCIAIQPEQYVVQADGELHKCWNTVGQKQYAVGNILDPLRNPVSSANYQRWMKYDVFDGKLACTTCTWAPSCMGGCPYHAVYHEQTAAPDAEVYLECTTFKYNFRDMLPRFAAYLESGNEAKGPKSLCSI